MRRYAIVLEAKKVKGGKLEPAQLAAVFARALDVAAREVGGLEVKLVQCREVQS